MSTNPSGKTEINGVGGKKLEGRLNYMQELDRSFLPGIPGKGRSFSFTKN